jgi:4-hydroxy-3-methylbut-2-enyl diphosphate reductase
VSEALLVLSPLRIECLAARRGAPSAEVLHTGMGRERSRSAATVGASRPARAVAVLGFCGALSDELEPGDVVIAEELRGGAAPLQCERLPQLEKELEQAGISINRGPILSVPKAARGAERARLAADGSIAVDMESAWLAPAAAGRPFAALRAVVDTPSRELVRMSTVFSGVKAYRAIRRAAGALESWAQTLADEQET